MLKKQITLGACITSCFIRASEQEIREKLNHAHNEYAKAHYATARAEYAKIARDRGISLETRKIANEWFTCLEYDGSFDRYSEKDMQTFEDHHLKIHQTLKQAAKLFRRAETKYVQHKHPEAKELYQKFLDCPPHRMIATERERAAAILQRLQK